MGEKQTNHAGLVIRTGGEFEDDLPFLLVHAPSGGILSEHSTNAAAHAAAGKFAELCQWGERVSAPNGVSLLARRSNARAAERLMRTYARLKSAGKA